jgi:uncharacterized protein
LIATTLRARSAALVAAWLLAAATHAQVPIAIPKLDARVTDLTGTFTATEQSELEQKLAAFERRKGAQIAVLILPSTAPEDIAQFGIRLAEAWQIGDAATDAGAILIVAKNDRALRIEVGDGLEGSLTDSVTARIINDTIVPQFKQGDYFAGVSAGVDRILRVVDGESLPRVERAWDKRGNSLAKLPLLLIALAVIGKFLRYAIGRAPAALAGAALGGGMAWIMTGSLIWAAVVGIGALLVIVWLTSTAIGSWSLPRDRDDERYRRRSQRGGWGDSGGGWGGGSSGGGWGGGSSGGGFSGGGGHFSGGGASGKW